MILLHIFSLFPFYIPFLLAFGLIKGKNGIIKKSSLLAVKLHPLIVLVATLEKSTCFFYLLKSDII